MKSPSFIIIFLFLFSVVVSAQAQDGGDVSTRPLDEDLQVGVEMQASLSDGKTPLWLNANKYGLSSLAESNGYFRASAVRPLEEDFKNRRFDLGYGLDMAAAYNYSSSVVVQQAYVEGRWLKGTLTIGSKQMPMELRNSDLSSGSQTFGINARPVPQVRVALADWWTLPVLNGLLQIKCHLSYGMMTDDKWQKDFTQMQSKYTENTLYQSKSGFLKIGKDDSRLSLTLGVETASLFGGTSHQLDYSGQFIEIKNSASLNAFWHAFVPGGADAQEQKYQNIEGDVLGSWLARVDYKADKWKMGMYLDHFFEDHSAMFHLDYDGYGDDDEWNRKNKSKYLLYDLKDMMIGLDWQRNEKGWLDNVVLEYIYTKYQSGAIYHDHTVSISDHIGGMDNYYNHFVWTGWQHWGQVMGNPLYLSPVYNEDGQIKVKNNRFVAYHLGLSGHPMSCLSYRVLASWQDAMGTYSQPYTSYKKSFNLLAELRCDFETRQMKGFWATMDFGMDRGNVHGNNMGIQLTIGRNLNLKKRKQ